MIIFSVAYEATAALLADADLPIVLWDNLVTVDNLVASAGEDADFPATNLASPATNEKWVSGSTAVQYLTVTIADAIEMDALGVARHNLGSSGVLLSVEGQLTSGGSWTELVEETLPTSDEPILFRFDPTELFGIRLKLQPSDAYIEPEAAILSVGKLLVFERGVQAGHTPLPYAREREAVTMVSVGGDYLGRVNVGGKLRSQVDIRLMSAAWWRANLVDFLEAAEDDPFFFAWRPWTYPAELGFAWMVGRPVPVPSHLAGWTDLSFQVEGLIL